MYEEYYGLKEKPFSIQPDPEFLYFGKRHSLAYAMLEYGVENRAGFTVITGEVGSGKTTLIRHLLNGLPDNYRVGLITNTHRDLSNVLEWVLQAFGQPFDGLSRVGLFDAYQKFLISEYQKGNYILLIVDEAQNLSLQALEELRILSNINADKYMLFQLILTGQPELKEMLSQPELRQFAQRVAVDFHLSPLEQDEIIQYILHRLEVAGRTEPLFTRKAIHYIALASQGIPRVINILCDTALVYGMSHEATLIDESIVEEVVKDRQQFGVLGADHAERLSKTG